MGRDAWNEGRNPAAGFQIQLLLILMDNLLGGVSRIDYTSRPPSQCTVRGINGG